MNQSKMAKPNLFDELVDQYKIRKLLAQSGVTDVYLAYDVDENREVVVEILLPFLAQNRTYADRFATKMRQVTQIKHRHISQVLQVGLAPFNNRPYFARENIDYFPLSKRIRELRKQDTPVHSVYALKTVRQIAEALNLAERLEIFHYDLQPEKVWIQPNGNVVLANLGMPRLKNLSNNGIDSKLNPNYWSPEQIQGKPIGTKSHVYSLGVILYELLTGVLPTTYDSLWQNITSSANQRSLSQHRPDLSMETNRLVNRAIRTQHWGRFNNCKELIAAIDEAIKAEEFIISAGNAKPQRSINGLWLKFAIPLLVLVVLAATILFAFQSIRNGGETAVSNESLTAAALADTVTQPANTSTPTSITPAIPVEGVTIFAPAPGQIFNESEAINFAWTWATPLENGEQFIVEALTPNRQFIVGQISDSPDDFNYNLVIPAAIFTVGTFEWQVTLDSLNKATVVQSDSQKITIVTAPTNTPTPSATPTLTPEPTETPTPTPNPQVKINISSASLRQGPSTRYDIIRFLKNGDIVTVIAINRENGNWYNVITEDGILGWLAISVSEQIGETAVTIVPTAATIPPTPTPTNTATPTPTHTPAPTKPPSSGGGGGGGNNGGPKATRTPPPPP